MLVVTCNGQLFWFVSRPMCISKYIGAVVTTMKYILIFLKEIVGLLESEKSKSWWLSRGL